MDLTNLAVLKKLTGKGGGGVSSWNDLTDKPFGESETGGEILYWDGNTEGLVSVDLTAMVGANFYKVSDAILTNTDFASGVFYQFSNGEGGSARSDEIIQVTDGILFLPPSMFFCVSENGVGVDLDGVSFPESGLYFSATSSRYISAFNVPNYTGFPFIKKLDEKYLPEHTHAPTYYNMGVADSIYLTNANGEKMTASEFSALRNTYGLNGMYVDGQTIIGVSALVSLTYYYVLVNEIQSGASVQKLYYTAEYTGE